MDFILNMSGTVEVGYPRESLAAIANAAFISLGEFAEYLNNGHNEGKSSLGFNITVQTVDITDEGYVMKTSCDY